MSSHRSLPASTQPGYSGCLFRPPAPSRAPVTLLESHLFVLPGALRSFCGCQLVFGAVDFLQQGSSALGTACVGGAALGTAESPPGRAAGGVVGSCGSALPALQGHPRVPALGPGSVVGPRCLQPEGMSEFDTWRSGQGGRWAEQLVWLLFWHLSWCCVEVLRLKGFRLLSVIVAHV